MKNKSLVVLVILGLVLGVSCGGEVGTRIEGHAKPMNGNYAYSVSFSIYVKFKQKSKSIEMVTSEMVRECFLEIVGNENVGIQSNEAIASVVLKSGGTIVGSSYIILEKTTAGFTPKYPSAVADWLNQYDLNTIDETNYSIHDIILQPLSNDVGVGIITSSLVSDGDVLGADSTYFVVNEPSEPTDPENQM